MGKTIGNQELSGLTLELYLLLHAGVGVGDALSLLGGEPAYKDLLAGMAEQADSGAPLSQCLRDSGRFPAYLCGLIQVGEETGRTEEALRALSEYYERRMRLDRRVRSALLYPAVMLVLMLVVIGVLLMRVLPIFNDVYISLGSRLTGVAGGLLAVGRALDSAMPVLWALLALVVALCAAFAGLDGFRERVLNLLQNLRGDRGLSRRMNNARLTQALSMGMASGLPLEKALELSASLLADNPPAQARCRACCERLEQGASLSEAMGETALLPAASCRLLELGQRSGAGDMAMEKIARDLSEDSEAAVEEMVSRVEPALVLVCSVLVGLILLSVMLPLMHIMSAIG